MIYAAQYFSPVGEILLAEKADHLIGLWMQGQKYFFGTLRDEIVQKETPIIMQTKAWLDRYFVGQKPEIGELNLAPAGSEFRQVVWSLLREIPYGQTTTYGELARRTAARMGLAKMSAQAVGGAVGHNPISIIIPCHRVVGADGSLTGYAGGINTKVKLLKHEGVDMSGLFVPQKGTAL